MLKIIYSRAFIDEAVDFTNVIEGHEKEVNDYLIYNSARITSNTVKLFKDYITIMTFLDR